MAPGDPLLSAAPSWWRRLRVAAALAVTWGLLMSINSGTPTSWWLLRTCAVVFAALLAYCVTAERGWPA